jgi:hypothetical protein
MQKGNKKKRDFKYYNCGKLNHIARNCKSLKKERIPKLKNNYTIEKDNKSVYIIKRLTLFNNKDNYKFYYFKSKLLNNSKTLDKEPEAEILN